MMVRNVAVVILDGAVMGNQAGVAGRGEDGAHVGGGPPGRDAGLLLGLGSAVTVPTAGDVGQAGPLDDGLGSLLDGVGLVGGGRVRVPRLTAAAVRRGDLDLGPSEGRGDRVVSPDSRSRCMARFTRREVSSLALAAMAIWMRAMARPSLVLRSMGPLYTLTISTLRSSARSISSLGRRYRRAVWGATRGPSSAARV